jgi:hypothetical protein
MKQHMSEFENLHKKLGTMKLMNYGEANLYNDRVLKMLEESDQKV